MMACNIIQRHPMTYDDALHLVLSQNTVFWAALYYVCDHAWVSVLMTFDII